MTFKENCVIATSSMKFFVLVFFWEGELSCFCYSNLLFHSLFSHKIYSKPKSKSRQVMLIMYYVSVYQCISVSSTIHKPKQLSHQSILSSQSTQQSSSPPLFPPSSLHYKLSTTLSQTVLGVLSLFTFLVPIPVFFIFSSWLQLIVPSYTLIPFLNIYLKNKTKQKMTFFIGILLQQKFLTKQQALWQNR